MLKTNNVVLCGIAKNLIQFLTTQKTKFLHFVYHIYHKFANQAVMERMKYHLCTTKNEKNWKKFV